MVYLINQFAHKGGVKAGDDITVKRGFFLKNGTDMFQDTLPVPTSLQVCDLLFGSFIPRGAAVSLWISPRGKGNTQLHLLVCAWKNS